MTQDELEKIHVNISKLMAETMRINGEAPRLPFMAVAVVFAAALALVKLLS